MQGRVRSAGRSRRRSTLGLETLVVYAFSTENWARPADEVADLIELLSETIDGELPDLAEAGRPDAIPRSSRPARAVARGEDARRSRTQTAHLDTLHLWIAFDYGGRAELVEAARRLVEDGVDPGDASTRGPSASRLYAPEIGEIDLLVRTSGELRLSNFLLWEAAYAELVFTDTLWPDFGSEDLRAAVEAYTARQRRFGARAAS